MAYKVQERRVFDHTACHEVSYSWHLDTRSVTEYQYPDTLYAEYQQVA